MAKEWTEAKDSVGTIAGGLIPNYHADLATARIEYHFINEAATKGGIPVLGRVKKVSGFLQYRLDTDYIIEVPLDIWQTLKPHQRTALVDHLLERCYGEEDEKTGEMRWKQREPNVQEFDTILDRYGAWHAQLAGFVSIAKRLNLDGFEDTEEEVNLNEESGETVETTEAGASDSGGGGGEADPAADLDDLLT